MAGTGSNIVKLAFVLTAVDEMSKVVGGAMSRSLAAMTAGQRKFVNASKRIGAVGAAGLGLILGKSIKSGMEQEMRDISFEVLFQNAAKAKKVIEEIKNYANASPYGRDTLSNVVQTMAGYEVPFEKILPAMKAMGDIAIGSADKMDRLSLAFSQVMSQGRLRAQELNQFRDAQFNPLRQIGKDLGLDPTKDMSKLTDMMRRGQISAEMVANALVHATQKGGTYYDMINKLNKTVGGQFAISTDNIKQQLLDIYEQVLQPLLLPALKALNKLLDTPVGKGIMAVALALTAIMTVIGGVGMAFQAFGAIAVTLGVSMGTLTVSMLGIIAIIAAVAVAAYLIYKYWEPIKKFFKGLWDSVKSGITTAWNWIKNVFLDYTPTGLIIKHWSSITAWFSKLWNGVKSGVVTAWNFIKKIFLNYTPTGLIIKHWSGITAWFGSMITKFKDFGKNIITGLISGIKNAWKGLKDTVSSIGTGISNTFKGILGINSPSKVFAGFGLNITAGLTQGLSKGQGLAQQRVGSTAQGIIRSGQNTAMHTAYGGSVTFAPVYNVSGNVSRADIQRANDTSFAEFKAYMRRYNSEKERRRI